MLIVLPSDPTTQKAAEYLTECGYVNQMIPIPLDLGYKTAANQAIYLPGNEQSKLMRELSAKGFVIMRIFKDFELRQ